MVVIVLRAKVLPDAVGAADDGACRRRFLLGGVVEESRFTSIPCVLVLQVKT
jgi:hypothetical protein